MTESCLLVFARSLPSERKKSKHGNYPFEASRRVVEPAELARMVAIRGLYRFGHSSRCSKFGPAKKRSIMYLSTRTTHWLDLLRARCDYLSGEMIVPQCISSVHILTILDGGQIGA